jgi:general secretion pathway protein I
LSRRAASRGFSLLEVVIALAILSLSLVVLLQAQGQALASAGRSRDLTIATLLARGKMVDLEQHLFHDGFTLNTEESDGDFTDEGYPDFKWKTRVSEVELDLSTLRGLCGNLGGKHGRGDAQEHTDCESTMDGIGGMLGGLTEEVGRSIRAAELEVHWPEGKYAQSLRLRALITRDDFQMQQESELMRTQNQLQGGQAGQLGQAAPAGLPGAVAR